ncbi:DUF885 domain-containing protein [Dyadobacter luticola]|uniref:DUF885 domain-containing protein n=1 Tax=Dyadobacter luticola TaxID=1979387 RepID=A0A5R9L0L2_9BACT|nr:DUF885 domain-containing protein [Dyadobacter luticola]TLV02096.1 DUF885 domain-containing protein [Dyadobacter luticola]
MKNFLLFLFAACTLLSCKEKSETGSGDFGKMSDSLVNDYLAWRPQYGVYLGYHEYDGKMTDLSKASIDAELARLKMMDAKLSAIDSSTLSTRDFYDLQILQHGIKTEIFNMEELGIFTKNPMTYAGAIDANIYIKRAYAPIEDRLKAIIAMENQAPALYENAKANLLDTLAKPYVETAIQIARGSTAFLGGDLVTAIKDVKNDTLMSSFKAANKKAIDAINAYADYLEKEKLPKSHNRYAIGREKYQKMLTYNEGITLTPERILEIGLRELKKEQEIFNAAAKIIDPAKKPVEVYNDLQNEHPTAEKLLPDTRKTLESIRQYLIDKKIVTMPSEVRVKVEETPQYARETSTASMDSPGPFEKKSTEAYYYITPVNNKWTPKQQEDWLRQFNYFSNDVVTIHEAYPGHYTQFLHLNASSASRIEKIFASYAFVEGWAHYTEKMMLDDGFGNNGDAKHAAKYRLAQSGEALLRLCRLCVSVKTHCQGMTIDEGTKFFMDNWYQGDKPSRQEALRGTFDPGYLYYTIGKLQILKLRADYQKQEGANFSQQKFHDLILDNGMPPVRLLREVLLKDKSIWGDIL